MATKLKPNATESGPFLLGGDLPVHRLGFGAMHQTGEGIWGEPKDRNGAKALLKHVLELGIDFIDTADSYGPDVSETLISETLYPYPKGLVVATKGGLTRQGPNKWAPVGRAEYLTQCVEMSLRRLRLDCIDLYQLHRIDPKVPMEESLRALKRLQDQGKIRHIGLSEVTVEELQKAQKLVKIVSVQNEYNLENRKSEAVLEYCEKQNLGFIPWYPIGSGELVKNPQIEKFAKDKGATPAQIALAWLLKRSPVILPIPGTSSIEHLEENTGAASVHLTDDEFAKLNQLKF